MFWIWPLMILTIEVLDSMTIFLFRTFAFLLIPCVVFFFFSTSFLCEMSIFHSRLWQKTSFPKHLTLFTVKEKSCRVPYDIPGFLWLYSNSWEHLTCAVSYYLLEKSPVEIRIHSLSPSRMKLLARWLYVWCEWMIRFSGAVQGNVSLPK